MATLRELKGRIGSVASSEKITGAMKMISSAKMHKAESVLKKLNPFRDSVRTVIASLLNSDAQVNSPLTQPRTAVNTVELIVFGSDDGLCGAYNVNIFKGLLETISSVRARHGQQVEIRVQAVGKKMLKAVQRIVGSDPYLSVSAAAGVDSKSDGVKVKEFSDSLLERFTGGQTDEVILVYMHFLSAGRQRLGDEAYLPVSSEELGKIGQSTRPGAPCLFEPSADAIFSQVLPMYLLSQMQEAFAQNRASEQAARVMAMQSANDNAQKLLEQLQLEYNKLRQQGITTELLDIVGGQARD